MTVAPSRELLPGGEEVVITQKVFKLLLKGGFSQEVSTEILALVRELEEAHIKLLGDLVGVRGGRDLLADLLKEAQKENEQLQTALLMSKSTARPLMNRISQKVALQ
jgi:hypothetical protein